MNTPIKNRKGYSGLDQRDAKISARHSNYINIATQEAKKSPMLQKHGCIVVYKNEIISKAYNYVPISVRSNSIHAEIHALKKIKHKSFLFKDCTLYIVRIGPDSYNNPLKYSKPCPACASYINLCNIRKVFYSTNHEYDTMLIHSKMFGTPPRCPNPRAFVCFDDVEPYIDHNRHENPCCCYKSKICK